MHRTIRQTATWLGWLLAGGLGLVLGASASLAQPSNAEALQHAVRTELAQHFPSDVDRIQIRVKRASGEAGQVQQPRVAFRSLERLPRGAAQVRVLRRVSGRWQRAGWALLYIAHYDSVLVATRTLRSGDEITRRDVRMAWTETTRFRGEPLSASTFEEHDALFATRYLREGRTLRRGDVRPPYAANTGQSVTVQYQRGGFQMKLRCKAREPGFVGEIIRVYAPDTDTAYRARLIQPGLAKWIETL